MDEKQPEKDEVIFPGAIELPNPVRLSEAIAQWLESVNLGMPKQIEAGD